MEGMGVSEEKEKREQRYIYIYIKFNKGQQNLTFVQKLEFLYCVYFEIL